MENVISRCNFFWNGILVKNKEIIEVDKTAYKQLVLEEHLCEDYNAEINEVKEK